MSSPSTSSDGAAARPSERTVILLVAAIQFINILDFMMVMPLGPDFAKGLGIPTAQLGLVSGSYALAAALTGFFGASVLDKFERRRALTIAVIGLVAGTAAGAAARGLGTMILARVIAGAFGGPATSLALSIVADVVPPARRGRAMSVVMGAFSIASIAGVPAGLALARHGGWQSPFLAVAGLGVVILAFAASRLPVLREHLINPPATTPLQRMSALWDDKTVRLALLTNALVFVAAFLVIPNISAYLQQNLHYPRPRLENAYTVGGLVSIFVLAIAGRGVDKRGPALIATIGTVIFMFALVFGFIVPNRYFHLPTYALFGIFMAGMSMRNISLGSLSTRVPRHHERAGYMSLQSVSQHLSSAVGGMVSTRLLHNLPDGRLGGIAELSTLSLVIALALPPLLVVITRRVRTREALTSAVAATPQAVASA
ncbi:MAG TPA: MFS transporter [Polyangia bacterium]|nr:MFS transporter [Polyangia bacterium]